MEGGVPEHDETDPRIGTTLDGRYHLLRRLGAGGFGVVYEAEHVLIRRKVAVKMLHAHVAADADLLARFKREAIAATATGHPHIVEVLDMGRAADGAAYMVLELLAGRDWAAVLEAEGPQPLGRTVHIVRQVLDALGAAHDKGIVHRDLKAENVFLVARENEPDFVKIVDFGISKMREEGGGSATGDVAVTHTGMALGTPVSMAPEQFQGKKDGDHRVDLWAVGVMLYRALTGRYPFGGDTYAMLAVNVMTENPTPLRELRPDVPAGIATILMRLMEKDRERRYERARDVRAALLAYEGDSSPAPSRASVEKLALAATQIATAVDSRPRGAVTKGHGESDAAALASTAAGLTATRATTTAVAPASRGPLLVGIALALGLAGIGGVWALGGSVEDPTPLTAEPTAASSTADDDADGVTVVGAAPDTGPAAVADGHLVLWTTPSCLVSRDGAPLGFTPLTVDLPPGTHVLTLENPDAHIVTTYEVTIAAGETRQAVVDLTAPESGATARPPRGGGHVRGGATATGSASGGGTPPAEAPPVVTAPVVTPPVETPPVETPPVETPRPHGWIAPH